MSRHPPSWYQLAGLTRGRTRPVVGPRARPPAPPSSAPADGPRQTVDSARLTADGPRLTADGPRHTADGPERRRLRHVVWRADRADSPRSRLICSRGHSPRRPESARPPLLPRPFHPEPRRRVVRLLAGLLRRPGDALRPDGGGHDGDPAGRGRAGPVRDRAHRRAAPHRLAGVPRRVRDPGGAGPPEFASWRRPCSSCAQTIPITWEVRSSHWDHAPRVLRVHLCGPAPPTVAGVPAALVAPCPTTAPADDPACAGVPAPTPDPLALLEAATGARRAAVMKGASQFFFVGSGPRLGDRHPSCGPPRSGLTVPEQTYSLGPEVTRIRRSAASS
jgi:hypothetical protein